MDIQKLAITAKEETGVWFKADGAEFLVCSVEKPAYKRAMREKARPYRRQLSRGTLADETVEQFSIEAVAEHILLDWKGVTDKGQPVPYSRSKAVELLTKYRKFYDMISEFAADQASFQNQLDDEGIESAKKG